MYRLGPRIVSSSYHRWIYYVYIYHVYIYIYIMYIYISCIYIISLWFVFHQVLWVHCLIFGETDWSMLGFLWSQFWAPWVRSMSTIGCWYPQRCAWSYLTSLDSWRLISNNHILIHYTSIKSQLGTSKPQQWVKLSVCFFRKNTQDGLSTRWCPQDS